MTAGVGLLLATSTAQPVQAQTVTFGPNGVQVGPNSPPDAGPDVRPDDRPNYLRHDDRDHGDQYSSHHGDRFDGDHGRNDRWHEVRERMHEYRDECRDGDRGACVRLGIIIGQNQARREDWQRDHPSYFWWERD